MPHHCVLPPALTAITHTVTVTAGRFAPGYLGELTVVVPFELVDAVLAETRAVQRRLRDLPSRVGLYFLLAMCLFPEVVYRLVWASRCPLVCPECPVACPSAKALPDLRRRIGSAPVRALFEVLAGLLARPTTPGVRFGPYRTVSFDGCSSLRLPDSERNRAWLGGTSHHGYPTLELMTLIENGTRALVGAVFGPTAEGETSYAGRLLHLLRPDMLVLWDKGFDSNAFLAAVTDTSGQVLGRLRSSRRTPVRPPLADTSYFRHTATITVRQPLRHHAYKISNGRRGGRRGGDPSASQWREGRCSLKSVPCRRQRQNILSMPLKVALGSCVPVTAFAAASVVDVGSGRDGDGCEWSTSLLWSRRSTTPPPQAHSSC